MVVYDKFFGSQWYKWSFSVLDPNSNSNRFTSKSECDQTANSSCNLSNISRGLYKVPNPALNRTRPNPDQHRTRRSDIQRSRSNRSMSSNNNIPEGCLPVYQAAIFPQQNTRRDSRSPGSYHDHIVTSPYGNYSPNLNPNHNHISNINFQNQTGNIKGGIIRQYPLPKRQTGHVVARQSMMPPGYQSLPGSNYIYTPHHRETYGRAHSSETFSRVPSVQPTSRTASVQPFSRTASVNPYHVRPNHEFHDHDTRYYAHPYAMTTNQSNIGDTFRADTISSYPPSSASINYQFSPPGPFPNSHDQPRRYSPFRQDTPPSAHPFMSTRDAPNLVTNGYQESTYAASNRSVYGNAQFLRTNSHNDSRSNPHGTRIQEPNILQPCPVAAPEDIIVTGINGLFRVISSLCQRLYSYFTKKPEDDVTLWSTRYQLGDDAAIQSSSSLYQTEKVTKGKIDKEKKYGYERNHVFASKEKRLEENCTNTEGPFPAYTESVCSSCCSPIKISHSTSTQTDMSPKLRNFRQKHQTHIQKQKQQREKQKQQSPIQEEQERRPSQQSSPQKVDKDAERSSPLDVTRDAERSSPSIFQKIPDKDLLLQAMVQTKEMSPEKEDKEDFSILINQLEKMRKRSFQPETIENDDKDSFGTVTSQANETAEVGDTIATTRESAHDDTFNQQNPSTPDKDKGSIPSEFKTITLNKLPPKSSKAKLSSVKKSKSSTETNEVSKNSPSKSNSAAALAKKLIGSTSPKRSVCNNKKTGSRNVRQSPVRPRTGIFNRVPVKPKDRHFTGLNYPESSSSNISQGLPSNKISYHSCTSSVSPRLAGKFGHFPKNKKSQKPVIKSGITSLNFSKNKKQKSPKQVSSNLSFKSTKSYNSDITTSRNKTSSQDHMRNINAIKNKTPSRGPIIDVYKDNIMQKGSRSDKKLAKESSSTTTSMEFPDVINAYKEESSISQSNNVESREDSSSSIAAKSSEKCLYDTTESLSSSSYILTDDLKASSSSYEESSIKNIKYEATQQEQKQEVETMPEGTKSLPKSSCAFKTILGTALNMDHVKRVQEKYSKESMWSLNIEREKQDLNDIKPLNKGQQDKGTVKPMVEKQKAQQSTEFLRLTGSSVDMEVKSDTNIRKDEKIDANIKVAGVDMNDLLEPISRIQYCKDSVPSNLLTDFYKGNDQTISNENQISETPPKKRPLIAPAKLIIHTDSSNLTSGSNGGSSEDNTDKSLITNVTKFFDTLHRKELTENIFVQQSDSQSNISNTSVNRSIRKLAKHSARSRKIRTIIRKADDLPPSGKDSQFSTLRSSSEDVETKEAKDTVCSSSDKTGKSIYVSPLATIDNLYISPPKLVEDKNKISLMAGDAPNGSPQKSPKNCKKSQPANSRIQAAVMSTSELKTKPSAVFNRNFEKLKKIEIAKSIGIVNQVDVFQGKKKSTAASREDNVTKKTKIIKEKTSPITRNILPKKSRKSVIAISKKIFKTQAGNSTSSCNQEITLSPKKVKASSPNIEKLGGSTLSPKKARLCGSTLSLNEAKLGGSTLSSNKDKVVGLLLSESKTKKGNSKSPNKIKIGVSPSPKKDKICKSSSPNNAKVGLSTSPYRDKTGSVTLSPSKAKDSLSTSPYKDKTGSATLSPSKAKEGRSTISSNKTSVCRMTSPSKAKVMISSPMKAKKSQSSTPKAITPISKTQRKRVPSTCNTPSLVTSSKESPGVKVTSLRKRSSTSENLRRAGQWDVSTKISRANSTLSRNSDSAGLHIGTPIKKLSSNRKISESPSPRVSSIKRKLVKKTTPNGTLPKQKVPIQKTLKQSSDLGMPAQNTSKQVPELSISTENTLIKVPDLDMPTQNTLKSQPHLGIPIQNSLKEELQFDMARDSNFSLRVKTDTSRENVGTPLDPDTPTAVESGQKVQSSSVDPNVEVVQPMDDLMPKYVTKPSNESNSSCSSSSKKNIIDVSGSTQRRSSSCSRAEISRKTVYLRRASSNGNVRALSSRSRYKNTFVAIHDQTSGRTPGQILFKADPVLDPASSSARWQYTYFSDLISASSSSFTPLIDTV